MQLYIPTINESLTLLDDWPFTLSYERRNMKFLLNLKEHGGHLIWPEVPSELSKNMQGNYYSPRSSYSLASAAGSHLGRTEGASLPAGTVLKVVRLYIRGNQRQYDSITMSIRAKGVPGFPKVHGRFWISLDDFNGINATSPTIVSKMQEVKMHATGQ